jgi:hypothetical protein
MWRRLSEGSGMIDATEFRNVMGNLGERFTIPEGGFIDSLLSLSILS